MEQMIPGFLEEMLKKQYGEEAFAKILAGYQARRPVTLRVNPLKADRNSVEQALTGAGIAFKNVSWYEDAMIIEGAREPEIQELPIYKEGGIYLQSLSSMLPPLFLGPKAGESVLDMAAAPGGKTTQIDREWNSQWFPPPDSRWKRQSCGSGRSHNSESDRNHWYGYKLAIPDRKVSVQP